MSKLLLSILIPTVDDREECLSHLRGRVMSQYPMYKSGHETTLKMYGDYGDEACMVVCSWDKSMTIGEKRELLYKHSEGKFSWQIDDDDDIADNAIELILKAIKENPEVDCITFQEHCIMDGIEYSSNHLLEYPDWEGDGSKLLSDGFHFHRTPFMKSVIKTEIARSVPIPHIRFGEDHQWAQALKPHLKTEIHIPRNLYFYQHQSSDFNTRYGFDK